VWSDQFPYEVEQVEQIDYNSNSMLKETAKSILKKLGFRVSRTHFGLDQWDDTATVLGRNPEVAFDVGANIGQTALTLSKRFPHLRIHSFEPFPKSFALLQNAVARYPNVITRNLGLGDNAGRQSLYVNPDSEWNSVLKLSDDIRRIPYAAGWPLSQSASTIDIEMSTIDRYCRENEINQIDLLKIDTQGYELAILKGALGMLESKRVRVLFMEMNFVPMYDGQASFEELYHYMRFSGYRLSGLYDRCFTEDRAIMYCDGLFVA
jgi:FkbM family methyltransferase